MTCASLILEHYAPDSDATIVTRMLDEGAEINAILNLDNFAFSGAGDTSAFGPTLNPHSADHLAGGSSGGSAAALYYDDIDMTIGGDQGGSIRIPASFCGIVGHMPSHGLVPYTGIVGIDNTFDHTGPMTRTVYDAALLLEVIAGKDPLDPRQGEVPVQDYTGALAEGAAGLRVGVLTEGFGLPESHAEVDLKVRQAANRLAELGAAVEDVSIPWHSQAKGVTWSLIAEGATALLQTSGTGRHFEGQYSPGLAHALGQGLKAQGNDLPPTVKLVLLIGSYMTENYNSEMYAKAQNMRRELRAAYDEALSRYDLLLMPTTPMPAHRNDAGGDPYAVLDHGWDMLANTAPFDMTGHPAISVPCGKTAEGLPVGLMLVGRHFEDGDRAARGPRLRAVGGLGNDVGFPFIPWGLSIQGGASLFQGASLNRQGGLSISAGPFYSRTPSDSREWYSSPVRPMMSRRKCSVCWPSWGAGVSRLPGVSDSLNSLASVA